MVHFPASTIPTNIRKIKIDQLDTYVTVIVINKQKKLSEHLKYHYIIFPMQYCMQDSVCLLLWNQTVHLAEVRHVEQHVL